MPRKNKKEEIIEEPKTTKKSSSKVKEEPKKDEIEVKSAPKNDEPTISEKKEYLRRKKLNSKKYISFNTRFIISLLVFMVLLTTSLILIVMSISKINEQTVDYKESSKIEYNVLLKDDSYYDSKYFKNNNRPKIYISSLIKNIDTTFDYNFGVNEDSNLEFNYNVIGKLVILNADSTKVFYDDEIELVTNNRIILNNEKRVNIHETIDIDYEYYNNIANTFRQNYGLNITSYLEVIINVKSHNLDDKYDLNDNYSRSIKIPLAQQEVDIQVDDDKTSSVHKVIVKNKLLVSNRLFVTIGVVALIIAIICLMKIVNMILKVYTPKISKYDRYIKKILKEYDRLIVNTTTAPNITDFRIVRINSFAELLDVHDNLNLPIRYYVITEHQKSIFYVAHHGEVYVYIVKAVDLEKY